MKRIIITSSIMLLLSAGVFIYFKMHGPESPYNAALAKKDIRQGKIRILSFGFPSIPPEDMCTITKKYGFIEDNLGCVIDGDIRGVQRYNEVMSEWLEKRNGKGWEERFNKDIEEYLAKKKEDAKEKQMALSL